MPSFRRQLIWRHYVVVGAPVPPSDSQLPETYHLVVNRPFTHFCEVPLFKRLGRACWPQAVLTCLHEKIKNKLSNATDLAGRCDNPTIRFGMVFAAGLFAARSLWIVRKIDVRLKITSIPLIQALIDEVTNGLRAGGISRLFHSPVIKALQPRKLHHHVQTMVIRTVFRLQCHRRPAACTDRSSGKTIARYSAMVICCR